MNELDVLTGLAEVVETVGETGDVWGSGLLGAGVAVGVWRMRPGGGRHRTPSARWASVRTTGRTVAGTVRTAASALVHHTPDAPPVSCADGRPAVPADGRPPQGGREDGSG
ncbi:hypothetical protein ACFV27_00620 [Streptomyces antimycoticus]|uniref:hypothetical protein n=1 Tax=Streptomyces antimycoticus TaxID=68175 RepID=UPI003691B367